MMLKNILLVGFGGMLGSIFRYTMGMAVRHNSFPTATLSVNILGSFVIGAVMALAMKHENFGDWPLFWHQVFVVALPLFLHSVRKPCSCYSRKVMQLQHFI